MFRLFGTKRALFIDVVTAAFDAMTDGMAAAAGDATGGAKQATTPVPRELYEFPR